jgi:hypothetical protein
MKLGRLNRTALQAIGAFVDRLALQLRESKSFGRSRIETPGRDALATANYIFGGQQANRAVSSAALASYEEMKSGLFSMLSKHFDDFDAGDITAGQLAFRLKRDLGATYERALELGMRGSGWLGGLQEEDLRWLRSVRQDEWRYLNRFVESALNDTGAMARNDRLRMYVDTVDSVFWTGRVEGLPRDAKIYWVLGVAEHCATCLEFAAGSPYTRETLPSTPRAGDTLCLSNCKCHLEFDAGAGIAGAVGGTPSPQAPSGVVAAVPVGAVVSPAPVPPGYSLPTPEQTAVIDSLALQTIFYAESAAKAAGPAADALRASRDAKSKELLDFLKRNKIHLEDKWPLETAIKQAPVSSEVRKSILRKSIGVALVLYVARKKRDEYLAARDRLDACAEKKTL